MSDVTRKPRGFAAMDPEQRRRVSAMGGRSVASKNRDFSKDRTLAKTAGKRGGDATATNRLYRSLTDMTVTDRMKRNE